MIINKAEETTIVNHKGLRFKQGVYNVVHY